MNISASRLRRISTAGGAGFLALALLATPASTLAKGGSAAVTNAGICSGATTSKIKVQPDNGRLEVEFEIDHGTTGQTWHVVLKHNGSALWSGNRIAKAPDGSFSVTRRTANGAGMDTFRGRAVNLTTGEVCRASASI